MAEQGESPRAKRGFLDWLDAIAKLVGATAVLMVAFLANSLQSRVTGVSIQSQREQAESQLRANMFNSLIGPIGGQTSGKPMPADRELLLTQLLALNFNENFELKPLMEDAAKRLIEEGAKKPADGEDPREPLWSIAHRISERQKAAIAREWSAYRSSKAGNSGWFGSARADAPECEAYYLTIDARQERSDAPITNSSECRIQAAFRDIIDLKSPDGSYTLRLAVTNPDWNNRTLRVTATPFVSKQEQPKATDTAYAFSLGWFDLPFTDNTLLPDGNRFAVYLKQFSDEFQVAGVTVVWFPKGYFTPRERPLNYSEVQELLGRKMQ